MKNLLNLYTKLLANDGITANVEMHKVIQGKSGAKHEIDVYWEFKVTGKTYKTAVECKHYNSTVEKVMFKSFGVNLTT